MEDVDVAIVGAGPAGLAAAVALQTAHEGLTVKVFEKARALKPAGFVVGMLPNGLKAVRAIDVSLWQSMLTLRAPPASVSITIMTKDGRIKNKSNGAAAHARYEAYGGGLFPLAWYDLQQWWASWAREGTLQLDSAFESYEDTEDGGVVVNLKGGRRVRARVLVGADGNQSRVRQQLLGDGPPHFSGVAIWRAMRQRPDWWPVASGMYSWTDEGGTSSVLTNTFPDGRLAWLVSAPWPAARAGELGQRSYIGDTHQGVPLEKLARCLGALGEGWSQHATDIVRTTPVDTIMEHALYYREPHECEVWGRGRVTLVGDAAHLTAAALGQGSTLAAEDALELARAVGEGGPTPRALRAYEDARKPLAHAVQSASVELMKLNWSGQLGKDYYLAEAAASEQFFSREWAPLGGVRKARPAQRRAYPVPGSAAAPRAQRACFAHGGCSVVGLV